MSVGLSSLLLVDGAIAPEAVAEALRAQGGPEWDDTHFRTLGGVDGPALAAGAPRPGSGTAISVASSGWWLRGLDDLALRLSTSGATVTAVVSSVDGAAWCRASSGRIADRGFGPAPDAWSAAIGGGSVAPLADVARLVHGDAEEGRHLPALGRFAASDDPAEQEHLLALLGGALTRGARWRPGRSFDPQELPPERMRALILAGPVRLPGPPRWARATRAVAVQTAQEVLQDDGWLALVPSAGASPAEYGTAVRVHQLAPWPDGTWIGVLHPRAPLRVERLHRGIATAVVVPQQPGDDARRAAALDRLIARLRRVRAPLVWDEAALRASSDPAALLGWQLDVDGAACQRYLAAVCPEERIDVLADSLAP